MDAKPLGRADERTHVSWVGNAVQSQDELGMGLDFTLLRDLYHGKDARRRVLSAHLLHVYLGDGLGKRERGMVHKEIFGGIEPNGFETGVEQFLHHLAAFDDEETEFLAELLLAQ